MYSFSDFELVHFPCLVLTSGSASCPAYTFHRKQVQWSGIPMSLRIICRVHHAKCQAEWIASWNQDCKENYQQPQICRYHSSVTKSRGTKEPLDDSERGEWKRWLKIQHSKNRNHDIRFHLLMANRWGRSVNNERFYFLGLKNHCGQGLQPQNWKTHSWEEKLLQI